MWTLGKQSEEGEFFSPATKQANVTVSCCPRQRACIAKRSYYFLSRKVCNPWTITNLTHYSNTHIKHFLNLYFFFMTSQIYKLMFYILYETLSSSNISCLGSFKITGRGFIRLYFAFTEELISCMKGLCNIPAG